MKSYNVDNYILNKDYIKNAIFTVCHNKHKKKGKITRKYIKAKEILSNIDFYVEDIYKILLNYKLSKEDKNEHPNLFPSVFKPTKPKISTIICDNKKERNIAVVPIYPDQIIHQLIIDVSKKYLLISMDKHSYGSIPDRGLHKAVRYIKKTIRTSKPSNIKYCAQLDITKCYPHIRHSNLKNNLRKKFRGNFFLSLCYDIIDSYNIAEDNEEARGLPIGFYTSQWFSNFVLTPLDHYIREELHVKYYIRNMDDMIIFGNNKKNLHKCVELIGTYLNNIGMTLKYNWQVFRFDYIDRNNKNRGRDLDFLGFRFFRNKTIQRRRNYLKLRRQISKLKKKFRLHKKITLHDAMSVISRIGALYHCDYMIFYRKYIKGRFIYLIKNIISKGTKINNKEEFKCNLLVI